ncbi:MAG TPA: hypothetical protein VHE55_02275 [Fimbriimonadaceae bacterium]|nr:hypothetical protein [Fimbriimonadaceae bacterium]
MDEKNPERLVIVTSTPDGVSPLTPGERSMLEHEGPQVEQTAVVSHSFPKLLPGDPARAYFEKAKEAFADSDASGTISNAQQAIIRQPNYLPAHIYEELGMNIARGRNFQRCVDKILATIDLSQRLLKGQVEPPPTESPIHPEHINEVLDMARYNLSDRYMRLGLYGNALEQLALSEMLPKPTEARMKRRLKEASLLFRLKDREGCLLKLKQARDMDRELFFLLRERMAFDGHAGVDQPI